MTDQVRDALLDSYHHDHGSVSNWIATLAPVVEKALRAAYWDGRQSGTMNEKAYSDRGVAAGIAVLTEGQT